eukprot:13520883-Alexandrium_andersonii.AAC.1
MVQEKGCSLACHQHSPACHQHGQADKQTQRPGTPSTTLIAPSEAPSATLAGNPMGSPRATHQAPSADIGCASS